MSETIFCISCDSRAYKDESTIICNSCLDLSFRKKTEWISVKDRLPETSESVLVTGAGGMAIAFICLLSKRFTQVNTWNDSIHESITHWMLLPEPPK